MFVDRYWGGRGSVHHDRTPSLAPGRGQGDPSPVSTLQDFHGPEDVQEADPGKEFCSSDNHTQSFGNANTRHSDQFQSHTSDIYSVVQH